MPVKKFNRRINGNFLHVIMLISHGSSYTLRMPPRLCHLRPNSCRAIAQFLGGRIHVDAPNTIAQGMQCR
ncbi:MAG: hypothetical protein DWH85_00195 [Planctomycetota bacterium]|nr:MAG: hypothetical protein DWH85_00195 [Planctomycetota bacterium]